LENQFVTKHKCIHDKEMKNVVIEPVPNIVSTSSLLSEGHSNKRATAGPLRVVFNLDALNSDPERMCTAVGQVIIILLWTKRKFDEIVIISLI
jgi:hypothetical protein